jgi:hypothetical protein
MGNCERLEPQILCVGRKCDVQALLLVATHLSYREHLNIHKLANE